MATGGYLNRVKPSEYRTTPGANRVARTVVRCNLGDKRYPLFISNATAFTERTMQSSSEDQVLGLLAKEWDLTGPPGILDISAVVAALPLAPSEVLRAVKTLFESGLVDMNALKTSVWLTPEGHERIETPT